MFQRRLPCASGQTSRFSACSIPTLSLAKVDQGLAHESREMFFATAMALIAVVFLSGLFIWIVVRNPLRELETGTERIASGKLGLSDPCSLA